MKKVLMVVALLLLATPAFAADVTITATLNPIGDMNIAEPNYTRALTIGWTGAAEANSIRAFALTLNADSGAHLDKIRDYNRGESKVPGGGFGIFPASFRSYITPYNGAEVNSWTDPRYSPLALWPDPNSGGGNDNQNMVVELGTLFVEPNSPGTSGTLFTIDVNNESVAECNVWIALDQIRGGVVLKDNTAADVCIPGGGIYVKFFDTCKIPLNEIGQTTAVAEANWIGQGFTIGTTTPVVDCVNLGKVISYSPTICTTLPAAIDYSYGVAQVEPNVIGMTRADAVTALNAAGYTVSPSDVNGPPTATITDVNKITAQNPPAGTSCGSTTVILSKVVHPMKTTAVLPGGVSGSLYANWVNRGRPACWAYPRQCRGDADGKKLGTLWVSGNDLIILKARISKTEAQLNAMTDGYCADFDHKKLGTLWVSGNDLIILKAYISKAEASIPMCGSVPSVPSADPNYWYWCVPTGAVCPAGQTCAPVGICPNTP
jgi:hypothetical protein